jgi:hypothetical protein
MSTPPARESWYTKRIHTLQRDKDALILKVQDIDNELTYLEAYRKCIWMVVVDELGADYNVVGTSALYVEGLMSEVEDKVRPHLNGRGIRSIRPADIIR